MTFAVEKVREAGNKNVMLTDRGNTFGYQDLVVDFRNIPENAKKWGSCNYGYYSFSPEPNQATGVTGGKPDLIETIGKAAIATGADGIFIENASRSFGCFI